MWFLILNILWLFFQNQNHYVVQSSKHQLNRTEYTSPKRLRFISQYSPYPNAGQNTSKNESEHCSCGFSSFQNVLSTFTLPHVLDPSPSMSSHTAQFTVRTTNFKETETLDECRNNPLLPFVDFSFTETGEMSETQGVDLLMESDELNDEIEQKLITDMNLVPSSQSQLMHPIETQGVDLLMESDELNDEIEQELITDMNLVPSTQSEPLQSMNDEGTFHNYNSHDIFSNVASVNTLVELQYLEEIRHSFEQWDSSTLEKYVKDALTVLPRMTNDFNNKSQNILCHQVECYTENTLSTSPIPNIQGIQDIQDTQDIQDILGIQDIQDTQNIQNILGIQDIQDIQDIHDMQDIQNIQDTQDIEDILGIQDIQYIGGIHDIQDTEDIQVIEGIQDVQDTEDIQVIEGIQDVQDTQAIKNIQYIEGIQDIKNIHDIQVNQYVQDIEDILGIQDIQNIHDIQGNQYVEDIEDILGIQNIQGNPYVQVIEGIQDVQDTQAIKDIQYIEGIQDIENIHDIQGNPYVQDIEGIQDIENIHDIQDNQYVQDIEDILGIQDIGIIHDIQGNPYVQDIEDIQDTEGIQNMQLKGVRLQDQLFVDHVTSTNITSIDSLTKEAVEQNKNHRTDPCDTAAGTFSQTSSDSEIASSKQLTDNNFVKRIMNKCITDFKLHTHVPKNKIDTTIVKAETWISCTSRLATDMKQINVGNSRLIQLYINIRTWVPNWNNSDHLNSIFEFLNSPAIFTACFVCLLAAYHKKFNDRIHKLKIRLLEKRNILLQTVERFLKIDEKNTSIHLQSLFNFCNLDSNIDHNCVMKCVLKWVFCSVQGMNAFNNMYDKLNQYHTRLELLYAYGNDFRNISRNEQDADAKAQDLKKKLELYVAEVDSFMNALEKEQNILIKELSHTFSNVTELAPFVFYHVGKILLILLSWNEKNNNNFLFILTAFNELVKICGKHIECKSHLTEELRASLTEKKCFLQVPFANMFLWIYKAYTANLKCHADKILKKINKETHDLGKLNANTVFEKIVYLKKKVHCLKCAELDILKNINEKIEHFEQHEPILSKLRILDSKIKILSHIVKDKSKNTRKEKLKKNASTFLEIIADFNFVFSLMGIETLEQKKVEQLQIYQQNASSTSSS